MRHLQFARRNSYLISDSISHLLEPNEIVYFGYNRFYKNHRGFCLYSDVDLISKLGTNDRVPYLDQAGFALKQGCYFSSDIFEILNMANNTDLMRIKKGCEQFALQYPEYAFSRGYLLVNKGPKYDECFFFIARNHNHKQFYYANTNMFKEICRNFQNHLHKNLPNENLEMAIPHIKLQNYKTLKDQCKITESFSSEERLLLQTSFGDILLAPQELRCLRYLAKGYTNIEIAGHMNLKAKTIENYIGRLKDKVSCDTRKDLLEYYYASLDG